MVAGALKNPWGSLGHSVRLDEAYLSESGGWPGGREVEAFFGDSSGFPTKVPDWDPEEDSDSEYLYIEELPVGAGNEMAKGSGGIMSAPRRKTPKKASTKTGGSSATSGSGGTPGDSSASPPGPTPSTSAGGGGGAGGSEPPGGGGGGNKKPNEQGPSPPAKKKRKTRGKTAEDEEDEGGATTAQDAVAMAAALPSTSTSATVSAATLPTTPQVKAAVAAEKAAEKAQGGAANMPPPAPPAAVPATGYPLYICGAGCNCNKMGREKLRREICESGTMAHMRENLDFIRWCEIKRDLNTIKEQQRELLDIYQKQGKTLENVQDKAQEAATVRKSETQITNDYELLSLKWTCLEDLQTGMATGPKQQAVYRVLFRLGADRAHFPRAAMEALFSDAVKKHAYPLNRPGTHKNRASVWWYGKHYMILPPVFVNFFGAIVNDKFNLNDVKAGCTDLKDHLNDARKEAKDEDKEKFVGRLDDPVYLLVWRDTTSGAHMIQESPPFQGTHEERQEFLARWEAPVNDKIAHKHPHGFHHPPA